MMSLALNVSSFFYLSVQWIATKDIAVLPMGHHSFIDSVIPFCPIAFLIYGTLFPVFIIFCFFCDRQRLFTLFKIIAVAQIICYPIFFFFPYQAGRPSSMELEGIVRFIYFEIERWDSDANTLPSLHVAYAFIIAHTTCQFRKFAYIWAVLIFFSVMLVKQHLFIDAVSGMAVAYISIFTVHHLENRNLALQKPNL
ncbi:MAG: phosphatase PAP2 family protein [Planctomycetes bacterium]|nr:phosphatase PAP2 family protein [Planctomycetota bacterium]